MQKDLTVCVVTYNCVNYLPDLIESLKNSSFKDFSLLFIDNASGDGTVDYINASGLEKTLIELPENMGHSYAVNLAMDRCDTRFLVLLDHDTVADKDLFGRLREEALKEEGPDYAVFAPKIIDRGRGETYYGGQFHFIGKTYTNRQMPDVLEVGMISSTAPLIDRNKIPRGLRFDNDLFIYWNDADFFYRLRALGFKIKLVPEAVVYHLGGTIDYSHRGGVRYSARRGFFVLRNHRLLVLKDYSTKSIILLAPCFLAYEIYCMAFCIRKAIFFKGYVSSLIGTFRLIPDTIKKRGAFQKTRKLGEKDLTGWYGLDYNPGVASGTIERFFVGILDNLFRAYYVIVKRLL